MDARLNFATSLVATAPSPATSGTSLAVTAGQGALFPAPPFNAVVCPSTAPPTAANAEVVRVTAKATDTFTITRAQEGSTARAVIVGDQFYAGVTKKTLDDIDASAPDYIGTWAAGTPYVRGNVVTFNGVDYLAVNPSTGQTPPSALTLVPASRVTGLVTADTGWTTMSLVAGSHYGTPFGPCQYRKLASGLVICRGLFTASGTAPYLVFTFPVGYRPSSTTQLIFPGASTTALTEAWRLEADNGRLSLQTAPSTAWVSMSSIFFFAEV